MAVLLHVGGLWISGPPDMIGALLRTSPTPFSLFRVIAMWAIFAVALLAAARWRLGLRPRTWRIAHTILAVVIVVGSVVRGLLIDGRWRRCRSRPFARSSSKSRLIYGCGESERRRAERASRDSKLPGGERCARVSTTDQDLSIQQAALRAARSSAEKRSGTTTEGRAKA